MTEAEQVGGIGLWDYAVELYGKTGVAKACIGLQDTFGLDVNLLLCCCWAGNRGQVLGPDRCRAMISATATWQDRVVRPLRGIRRWLKDETVADRDGATRTLREKVMALELKAEKFEQGILEAEAGPAVSLPSFEAAAKNLKTYLAVAEAPAGAGLSEALALLLSAAFPNADRSQIHERLAL